MPDPSYTALVDGDTLDAASLNTPFTNVLAGLNGIMPYGPARNCFQQAHLGEMVVESGWQNAHSTPESTLYISGTGTHNYSTTYTTLGGSNLTDREIIGSDSAGGGTYDSTNDQLVFNHSSGGVLLGMSRADRVGGILVLLNVEWTQATSSPSADLSAMIAIQFKSDAGATWYTIDRTERFMRGGDRAAYSGGINYYWGESADTDAAIYQDMALRTLITDADLTAKGLDPSTDTIEGIRAVTAQVGSSGAVELGSTSFTILPLHVKVL